MADKETGWFKTEGGTILEMDIPLSEPIAQRVERGEIVRVANAKGDAYIEPKSKRGKAAEPVDELKAMTAELDALKAALDAVTVERDTLKAAAEQRQAAMVPPKK